jgi:MYXO-CTERM domain-containing protein
VTGGGEISPGDIYWTNNLWYFDTKVKPYNLIDVTHRGSDTLLANITVTGDVVTTTDPGFKDVTSRSDPMAYDLVAGSVAIDKGTGDDSITKYVTTDFAGRARPAGAAFDLGAFEYGATSAGGSGGTLGAGGATGAGGTTTVVTGRGGAGGTATTTAPRTGGTTGTTVPAATGGALGSGGKVGSGGVTGAGGSTMTSTPSGAGGTVVVGSGGATGAGGTTAVTTTEGSGKSGCSCHLGRGSAASPLWLGVVGVALLALRRRRR